MTTPTRQRIFEIAEELLLEGRRPTQQLVRERMGSGSLTTINRALNEWWSSLSQRLEQSTKGYDIPEPVVRLSSRLWTETLAYARREHSLQRAELEKSLALLQTDLNTERSQHSLQLKELNQLINEVRQRNNTLEKQVETLRKALQESQDECFHLAHDQTKITLNDSSEELLEARVRLQLQQEQIELLSHKNQMLINENAELRLRLARG